MGYKVSLASYDATGANNADLPEKAILIYEKGQELWSTRTLADIVKESNVVIALTEFSATAPLHAFAVEFGIRAASMPGYNNQMAEALSLDFNDVADSVGLIYSRLMRSDSADIIFEVEGRDYRLHVDLWNRKPRRDDGNCREKGKVINLPTGEAFIVPYEGEISGTSSLTNGFLPIGYDGKVSIYKIQNNMIISTLDGTDDDLMKRIRDDPSVGNIAELGFGVLGKYGIKPCKKILLDEKLILHIALGRSNHLGGATGVEDFKDPANVWHQDYVYLPDMHIALKEVRLNYHGGKNEIVIRDGKYLIF